MFWCVWYVILTISLQLRFWRKCLYKLLEFLITFFKSYIKELGIKCTIYSIYSSQFYSRFQKHPFNYLLKKKNTMQNLAFWGCPVQLYENKIIFWWFGVYNSSIYQHNFMILFFLSIRVICNWYTLLLHLWVIWRWNGECSNMRSAVRP